MQLPTSIAVLRNRNFRLYWIGQAISLVGTWWQAMPPELVERPEIPKAVALMQSIFHGSRLLGPAIAGALMSRFGVGSAFLANGFSFLAVIASLLLIRLPARPSGDGASRRGAIAEGFRSV